MSEVPLYHDLSMSGVVFLVQTPVHYWPEISPIVNWLKSSTLRGVVGVKLSTLKGVNGP